VLCAVVELLMAEDVVEMLGEILISA